MLRPIFSISFCATIKILQLPLKPSNMSLTAAIPTSGKSFAALQMIVPFVCRRAISGYIPHFGDGGRLSIPKTLMSY